MDPKSLLASLYQDNHAWLRGWLSRQVRCPQDAADLTQDTFMRAWDARQLERIQEPRAYLSTVARRLLCSLWRRRKLEQSYLDQLASLPPAFAPSAEDLTLVREAIEAIDLVLEGLPSRVKRAFLLNRLEGMPQQAIAELLGVSLATVERDLRRAFIHCLSQTAECP
ncbi:sigma-70 family RNA polymerase sigma factor [Pseudomonas fragi]|uniref:sigma-70 family RNA polymerase sigma factor n=1 Tax=Pseudomonas fragi TaxID=296 RepID=UPI003D7D228E|nr:sigma-70 family RNA polymerase sigma factor [Pseudomonas fragi]